MLRKSKVTPNFFYHYTASKTTRKEGVADLTKTDGNLTQNDKEKCGVVDESFSSVFTIEDNNDIPDFNISTKETISSIDIKTVLNKLYVTSGTNSARGCECQFRDIGL